MDTERWRRAPCGLLALAIAVNGVAAAVRARNQASRSSRQASDEVSRFERETATLRDLLGRRDYVEYVTSVPNRRVWQDGARFGRLMLFQYALSPTVLGYRPPGSPTARPSHRLLIADFPSAAELDGFVATQAFEVRWRREGMALLWEP
jgi:hypothetical protein